jgi:hypothetical protein
VALAKLTPADFNFLEERERQMLEIAEIFQVPSEVVEKQFISGEEIEWREVVQEREASMSEVHDGCEGLEMEESSHGWGHKLSSSESRQVKGFRVSPEAFMEALTTQTVGNLTWTKVLRGIPPGARSLGATYELASRCWIVYIEHDSFPEVESGVRAPLCEIVFHQMALEGLVTRLREISRLVEQRDDDELAGKVLFHITSIMKLYFPEEPSVTS